MKWTILCDTAYLPLRSLNGPMHTELHVPKHLRSRISNLDGLAQALFPSTVGESFFDSQIHLQNLVQLPLRLAHHPVLPPMFLKLLPNSILHPYGQPI